MKKLIILLLLAICTVNLFSQELPYVGVVSSGGGTKGCTSFGYWDKYNLYYYIHNSGGGLTASQCETAIQNAFNTWSQYSLFTFSRTYNLAQADIELLWASGSHGNCGSFIQGELAHTSEGKTSLTPPSYIHFNDDIAFTMTTSPYNLETIALHSIGHVLGLEYDLNNPDAVMYKYYNGHKIDLTSYDYNALYSIYGFPTAINGNNYISSNVVYEINNHDKIPSNFTIAWSLTDSHYTSGYNLFIPYYYGQWKCLIVRDPDQDLLNKTLTATIKKGNTIIRTLTKAPLYAYAGFRGNYSSGDLSGNIDYTCYFNVRTNTGTTVFSPNFYGATVTYSSSGITPTGWGCHPDTGILDFTTATPNAAVVINVTDIGGNNYTLYAYATSQYKLNVSNGGSGITVSVVEDDDASKDFTPSQSWTLEVRNASTGVLMATQSSASRSESISTVGWPKGVYIVKVTIGEEELTEKVIVR